MKLTGVLLQGGVENLNHRSYSEETLNSMVKQFKNLKSPLFGEFGESDSIISLNNVSHKITDIKKVTEKLPRKKKKKFKKNNLYNTWKLGRSKLIADFEILDTPGGNLVKNFMNDCVIRPVGIGTVNENGVIEDYQLVSASIVLKSEDSFKGLIK